MTTIKRFPNGTWWSGRLYSNGRVKWNKVYQGEAAEVLDLLKKYGVL